MFRSEQAPIYYIIASCCFAYSFKDAQAVTYMFTAGFMVYIFLSRPDLFGPFGTSAIATVTPSQEAAPTSLPSTRVSGVRSRSVDRMERHGAAATSRSHRSPIVAVPTSSFSSASDESPIMLTTGHISRDWELNRKPSKVVFPSPAARAAVLSTSAPASTRAPSPAPRSANRSPAPGQKRTHRVPEVSAGHSPFAIPTRPSSLSSGTTVHASFQKPSVPPRSDSIVSTASTIMTPTVKSFFAVKKEQQQQQQIKKVEVPVPVRPVTRVLMKELGVVEDEVMVPMVAAARHKRSAFSSPGSVPSRQLSIDYDSDSSRASSSSIDTRRSTSSYSGAAQHQRTVSSSSARYNTQYTTVTTFVPKLHGLLPQIQAIVEDMREHWLTLPGSVSSEVGVDVDSDSIVIVETYASKEHHGNFERSPERHEMLTRLQPLVDEDKITILRLPGSSAARRILAAC